MKKANVFQNVKSIHSTKWFGYRKALVRNILFILDRDEYSDLESYLVQLSGSTRDNHCCCSVTYNNGTTLHYGFEDSEIWVGLEIEMQ